LSANVKILEFLPKNKILCAVILLTIFIPRVEFSTVDLLIKVDCFVKKVNIVCNIKLG
jgi:hypothetical protein